MVPLLLEMKPNEKREVNDGLWLPLWTTASWEETHQERSHIWPQDGDKRPQMLTHRTRRLSWCGRPAGTDPVSAVCSYHFAFRNNQKDANPLIKPHAGSSCFWGVSVCRGLRPALDHLPKIKEMWLTLPEGSYYEISGDNKMQLVFEMILICCLYLFEFFTTFR